MMWEMLTGSEPHANSGASKIIMDVVVKRVRPAIPAPPAPGAAELGPLISECWAAVPNERPAARAVVDKLGVLLAAAEAQASVFLLGWESQLRVS